MAPRETENNAGAMQNLGWQTKSIMVCYGIFWSGQLIWYMTTSCAKYMTYILFPLTIYSNFPLGRKTVAVFRLNLTNV